MSTIRERKDNAWKAAGENDRRLILAEAAIQKIRNVTRMNYTCVHMVNRIVNILCSYEDSKR